MEVERQVLRPLLLNDGNVLGKDLVIEIESLFDGGIFIEVAADGNEQASLSRGDGDAAFRM